MNVRNEKKTLDWINNNGQGRSRLEIEFIRPDWLTERDFSALKKKGLINSDDRDQLILSDNGHECLLEHSQANKRKKKRRRRYSLKKNENVQLSRIQDYGNEEGWVKSSFIYDMADYRVTCRRIVARLASMKCIERNPENAKLIRITDRGRASLKEGGRLA